MIIRHRGIYHERIEDAPFIGALICALDCNIGCMNCFNQHLKSYKIINNTEHEIINIIQSNSFNKGIILSGLEWSMQYEEAKCLLNEAKINGLESILYTGYNEEEFKYKYPDLYKLPTWIKFGKYDINQSCYDYKSYGVMLSSKNQYIKFMDNE